MSCRNPEVYGCDCQRWSHLVHGLWGIDGGAFSSGTVGSGCGAHLATYPDIVIHHTPSTYCSGMPKPSTSAHKHKKASGGFANNSMSIAILIQSYGRLGGAERLAFSHFAHLRERGCDVTLFYSGPLSEGWRKRLQNEQVRAIPSGISRSFPDLRALLRFLRELRVFDKIIIHHHVEPILAFYISRLYGRRVVWYSGSVFELPWEEFITGADYRRISPTVKKTGAEFYGKTIARALLSDSLYGLTTSFSRVIDIATVRSFGRVLANSAFLSRFLTRAYGLKQSPNVVYPGVDPILQQLASRNHAEEQDFVLAVGPLIPLKNVDTILRSAARAGCPKVVLVGDGQEKNRLRELGTKLNVPVEFRGTLNENELAKAYGECKMLVHLSLYEPFGLTPIEAGLYSKPCVVTCFGGPAESVIDGETGYVVNPRDEHAVSARMAELLENRPLRREMGRRARENVLRRFTLEESSLNLLAQTEGISRPQLWSSARSFE
jgi:glycosyltransferase involved in cell wall biosynthesis